jgi:hypothetical protein
MIADQIGWVEIMAVLSATVVSRSEGIQVAKCAARATPGAIAADETWGRLRVASIHPNVNPVASRHRYIAMARAGAEQAAINGADALTQTTAIASSVASRAVREPIRPGPPSR